MGNQIKMKTPVVEIDGDEMTRVLWKIVKEKLIKPFVDLKVEYYDLGLEKRNETNDQITVDCANAIKKYGVGIKCATITPNTERMKEYSLKEMWKSPNGTIRAILDGTVFRKPIMVQNIKPSVISWKKPITVGRHAYGDIYKNAEIKVEGPGIGELVFTSKDGKEKRITIQEFKSSGILQGIHNLDSSISSFAHSCFKYALSEKINLWFGAKDTISKTYDMDFKNIFEDIFNKSYKDKFEQTGIQFIYTLIDDTVARIMKSEGGILWACKNYDGDVMSDMVASAFGSLAMMSSVLVSPEGFFEYEAAHGTVQKHYYKHLKGEKTSTNSIALIFAWSGGLKKRGELDNIPELSKFATKLEEASLKTIENGIMTSDLAHLAEPKPKKVVNSEEFIDAIQLTLNS